LELLKKRVSMKNNNIRMDNNSLVLMSSISNTQKAITTVNQLSNSLSLVTDKLMDSLAKNSENVDTLKEIQDVIEENYDDDIELKVLIEKALNKGATSSHYKYIQKLHNLSVLSSMVSGGIKNYDGDINIYYKFYDTLNELGLL
tara:strand:+ start:410 stop:841 length:432 start_codon:yes stop_codon:yes gene_type:complete